MFSFFGKTNHTTKLFFCQDENGSFKNLVGKKLILDCNVKLEFLNNFYTPVVTTKIISVLISYILNQPFF
jgi:hypothetical protein